MDKIQRNSNFELLRIICIILVICGHITMYNGTLGQIGTINYYIGNIIRSFCMVAVNCFILISGYFGIKFSLKKLIKLECIVVFHTLLLFILAVIFKIHTISFKEDILLLMPVLTKRYWFITIYIALCVISPILNLIVNVITKEQYKKILIISIIMFYILPTFLYTINAPTITGDSGYGIINFGFVLINC
ncbi:acyltransferase family protein [Clostridium sp. NSJ-145]|uniref:acyltransferase family protein n=1 Tax=Clostridium sp. NSJ-145 TaxID=2897777 RepID=UPI001E5269DE|nr:acyltransferase family protein [Clostridium sp. NSJ-145]MCD2502886.1 acyltransferase family protein [Clostridium sp. NSJ-145]